MEDIKAGVVLASKFCKPGSKIFKGYVDYIDRDEAIRNENLAKFNLYNDYMDNPEKTGGLFTDSKNNLTLEEKDALKDAFLSAQAHESIMWQHVISFDNRWLEDQGMINKETGIVNSAKLQELTRQSMRQLQKAEKLENAIWSAAIHYNTDNIHIHVAMVEPIPMREKMDSGPYEGQYRGKVKQSSLDKAKSSVVNNILQHQPENDMINNIIRNNIIEAKKKNPLFEDKEFAKLFMEVHQELPKDTKLWNYETNAIKNTIPKIDQMSKIWIEKYCAEDYKQLQDLLKKQEEKYKKAYGESKQDKHVSYADNQIKDLYKRLGNTILKQIKDFDKQQKKEIYESAKNSGRKLSQADAAIYRNGKLQHSSSYGALKSTMEFTRLFLKDEFESFKNQRVYMVTQIQNQIENENDIEK